MRLALACVAVLVLAGCLGGSSSSTKDEPPAMCGPNPCPPIWPAGLEGPFPMAPGMPQFVTVPSHDGVELAGWLYLPDLPENVKAPTVLVSSPYYGLSPNPPGSDAGGAGNTRRYVENGYAVAAFSVRGTGVSAGCFENKGMTEQKDQAFLVEWIANQSWSNGRVAMAGTSYPGTTPFMAALQKAPHLTTILINGPVTDPYTELHTPQGALYTMGGAYEAGRRGLVTGAPLGALAGGDGQLPRILQIGDERICPELVQVLAGAEAGHFTDNRNAAFWKERQLVLGFPNITIPIFLAHGLQETAHPFQEDIAWEALSNAPKRMLLGQWDHEFPRVTDWQGMMLEWLDYWMKDKGTQPPGVGLVTYQDDAGNWHNTTQWPPSEAQSIAVHLNGDRLAPEAGSGGAFRSIPPTPKQNPDATRDHLCGQGVPGTARVYRSEPVSQPTLIAGNPMAYLQLESDQPGGMIALHLWVEPPAGCNRARLVSSGVADLRFHGGNFVGMDFRTGSPNPVRIDLLNLAAAVKAGERIALVASFGDTFSVGEIADPITDARFSRSGQPYAPLLMLHPGSHLILPLIGDGLEGASALTEYPARPFMPVTK